MEKREDKRLKCIYRGYNRRREIKSFQAGCRLFDNIITKIIVQLSNFILEIGNLLLKCLLSTHTLPLFGNRETTTCSLIYSPPDSQKNLLVYGHTTVTHCRPDNSSVIVSEHGVQHVHHASIEYLLHLYTLLL
jgi:hypothetical protein